MSLLAYKCPCCGGAIEFDSDIQKMKCPYCDTEFEMETLKEYDNDLNSIEPDQLEWQTDAGNDWQEGEDSNLRTYICQSCGGEVVGDETLAATSCPYCDNPVIVMQQFSGMLKPDFVIPFKLDKEAAKSGLAKHLSGKPLLPKCFKSQNHIDEIKGVYVPFWLFDADAKANVHYRATKVRMWSDSNYNYVDTSYYSVVRRGDIGFELVPVDGSTKMPDDLMESIEPFDFSDAVDFQTAYLSGYLADKYDVDAPTSVDRANERIRKSTEDAFTQTVVGYSSVTTQACNIQLSNGNAKYALYPVWLLNTTWKDKKYTFAMNGQTGKFAGDLPTDWGSFFKWLIGICLGSSAVVFAILYILWLL